MRLEKTNRLKRVKNEPVVKEPMGMLGIKVRAMCSGGIGSDPYRSG
mgnify:CR=1 FL=1